MKPAAPLTVIEIASLTNEVGGEWLNFPLTENNGHIIRASVLSRDFRWHAHENSDETFLVLEGELIIDLADKSLTLTPGQMLTVPRGVRHRTRAKSRTVNLTFEHRSTSVTGDWKNGSDTRLMGSRSSSFRHAGGICSMFRSNRSTPAPSIDRYPRGRRRR